MSSPETTPPAEYPALPPPTVAAPTLVAPRPLKAPWVALLLSLLMPGLGQRLSNATVYLVERKDRLVEDLRLLRVVVSTAFEGRLDRVNDRVDDYRRLLERRKKDEAPRDDKKSELEESEPASRAPRRSV